MGERGVLGSFTLCFFPGAFLFFLLSLLVFLISPGLRAAPPPSSKSSSSSSSFERQPLFAPSSPVSDTAGSSPFPRQTREGLTGVDYRHVISMTVLALLLFIGAAAFLSYLRKRRIKNKATALEIIDRLYLTPTTQLILVKIGSSIVRIAVGKDHVVSLGEMSASSEMASLTSVVRSPSSSFSQAVEEEFKASQQSISYVNLKKELDQWEGRLDRAKALVR